jgi:hypothetical protein
MYKSSFERFVLNPVMYLFLNYGLCNDAVNKSQLCGVAWWVDYWVNIELEQHMWQEAVMGCNGVVWLANIELE